MPGLFLNFLRFWVQAGVAGGFGLAVGVSTAIAVGLLLRPMTFEWVLVYGLGLAAGLATGLPLARALFEPDMSALKTIRQITAPGVPFDRHGRAAVRLRLKGMPAGLRASPTPLLRSVRTGEPWFDRTVSLDGPEDLILAALDGPTRMELSELMARTKFTIAAGRFDATLPARTPPEVVERVLARMERLCQRFEFAASHLLELLADHARTAREPAVRHRNIDVLLRTCPGTRLARSLFEDLFAGSDFDAQRVAARALGRQDLIEELDAQLAARAGQLSIAAVQPEEGQLSVVTIEGALSRAR